MTCADRLRWSSRSLGSMIALYQRAARWRADNHERSVRAIAGGGELHCDQHRRHRWPGAACGTDVWHLRGSGRQGPLAPVVVVRCSCGDQELHRDHVRPRRAQRVRLLALGRRRYPRLGNRTPDRSGRRYRRAPADGGLSSAQRRAVGSASSGYSSAPTAAGWPSSARATAPTPKTSTRASASCGKPNGSRSKRTRAWDCCTPRSTPLSSCGPRSTSARSSGSTSTWATPPTPMAGGRPSARCR